MNHLDIAFRAAREGLWLAVLLSAPFVLLAMAVGFVVSILQAATQIQEPTLSLAPKLLVTMVALLAFGPWAGAELVRFTVSLFQEIPALGLR